MTVTWFEPARYAQLLRYWLIGFLGIAAATVILAFSAEAESLRVTGVNGRALSLPVTRVQGVDWVNAADVARALGATLRYAPASQEATFTLADRKLVLLVGSVRTAVRRDGMEPVIGRVARAPIRHRGTTLVDASSVAALLRQVRSARFRPAAAPPPVAPAPTSSAPAASPAVSPGPIAPAPADGSAAGDAGSAPAVTPAPGRDGVAAFIRNIVIDAGHGDHDAGAIGPGGTREKDVNLGVALKLERLLSERLSARITLTRRDDTFLSLRERVAVARRVKADLFISVHANSSASRNRHQLSGTEVYFFSSPSDEDARLAERMEGGPFDPAAEGIDPVLWDLMLAGNVVESHRLAAMIMKEMPGFTGLPSRGVKSARFYVMYYGVMSNIPSILVELGFMSNPTEEAKLKNPAWQQKAAEGIAVALEGYLADLERRYPGGRGWSR